MTYTIIFFDVGIKNLSYCKVEFELQPNRTICDSFLRHKIVEWKIIDLTLDTEGVSDIVLCSCGVKATRFTKCFKTMNKTYICKKKKCATLYENTIDHGVSTSTKKNSSGQCEWIDFKPKSASSISLYDIGQRITIELDKVKSSILDVDEIVIENQPVHKQPTMKSVQMILFSYFIIRTCDLKGASQPDNIVMFHAKNKLDIYDGPLVECNLKNDYGKRKYLSVQYTIYFLNKTNQHVWLDFLINSKKKDDYADAYMSSITRYHQLCKMKNKKSKSNGMITS